MKVNKIYQGNSLEILKTFEDNSIDAVVTDPPYGLSDHKESKIRETLQKWLSGEDDFIPNGKGFMGKEWDAFVPPPALWKEVYRVMKPGAHILCFAGTRSVDLMTLSLRLAGFEVRDTLVWAYGSGFPKSLNIGKAIDKLLGNEREVIGHINTSYLKTLNEERVKQGYRPNVSKLSGEITKGNSEWEGWGTALKPAIEFIILARKPLSEKNVAENVLKWGTGGLNIDGCRIQHNDPLKLTNRNPNSTFTKFAEKVGWRAGYKQPTNIASASPQGRFPSNFIIQCNCDEVVEGKETGKFRTGSIRHHSIWNSTKGNGIKCNAPDNYGDKAIIHTNPECPCFMLDAQSGISKSIRSYRGIQSKGYSAGIEWRRAGIETNTIRGHNDTGGASRFFKQITFEPEDYLPFYYCAKASKSERNFGLEGEVNRHPTLKPIRLCQYLVKLITPPNGIVLDPFAGSGSTLIACKKLGFNFIGIELNPEYVLIAEKRLQAVEPNLFNEVNNGA
jgi:site-specific DNA-methyltransferase (adenine-specific)